MKIEEDKFYKTRDGRKAGPVRKTENGETAPWLAGNEEDGDWYYNEDGSLRGFNGDALDLVSEWIDEPAGPVRTETRQVIVPGVYERLAVENHSGNSVDLSFDNAPGHGGEWAQFDAAGIRALLPILSQLADALESNK